MYQKPKVERFGTFHELSMKREGEASDPDLPLLQMLPHGSGEPGLRESSGDENATRKRAT